MDGQLILREGETIEREAKISKCALAMIWVSIPAVFLVIFLTVYLPAIIRYSVDNALRETILAELGLKELSFNAIRSEIYYLALSFLPRAVVSFIKGFVTFLIVLLIICWAGWASVYTKMNMSYSLIITNQRIFAKAKNKVFQAEYSKILDVSVGKSLWGKLFNYGEILFRAEKDAITVRNIADAEAIKRSVWETLEKIK